MKIKTLLITLTLSAMAFAEEAAPEQPSAIASFLPLILLFVVMWLFFIRPKQKEMKQMDQMRKELKKGDKVMTSAGIIGVITSMEDNIVTVRTGSTTLIDFEKSAILRNMDAAPKAETKTEEKK